MTGWLVVRTHHQREAWACENILRQGAEFYLPRIVERSKLARRRRVNIERGTCLFPGYVFVKTDGQWRFLLGTFGVVGIVTMGSQPAFMREREIDLIRSLEDVNGLVVLPDVSSDVKAFRPGEKVRIAAGTFSGYVGVYQGSTTKERERVLLDYLGRKTTVLIGTGSLEEVG